MANKFPRNVYKIQQLIPINNKKYKVIMKKEVTMTRLSLYIDSNLVAKLQSLAEKDKRSVSFYASQILEKAVKKKIDTINEKCKKS